MQTAAGHGGGNARTDLVAERTPDAGSQQEEEDCQRQEQGLQGAVDPLRVKQRLSATNTRIQMV